MLTKFLLTGTRLRAHLKRPRGTAAAVLTAALVSAAAVLGPLAAIAVGARDHVASSTCTSTSGGTCLPGTTTTTSSTATSTSTSTTTTTCTPTTTSTSTTTSTTPTTTTTTSSTPTTTSTSTTTTTTTTCTPTTTPTAPPPHAIRTPKSNPFAQPAMWIWEMPYTDGGDILQIIADAKLYGIKTLIIKSGDGSSNWSQFNRTLVQEIHSAGLKVCGWQFVYGQHPVREARVGIRTVRRGADCLVIDAENQYEGRYVQAQHYINHLRKRIGKHFPVALAGFPYVDYHPSFPYSVFLGPRGAQYNVPQMYWKDIGVSVRTVYAHTFQWNEIYRRPIYPLGQMFSRPPIRQIQAFNALEQAYGSHGVSWWVWQDATATDFQAVTQVGTLSTDFTPSRTAVTISRGEKGDYVIWAQELLAGWALKHETGSLRKLAIDGDFGPLTLAEVEAYQARHHLPVTGVIDGYTWDKLVHARVLKVRWVWRHHHRYQVARRARRRHRRRHRAHVARAHHSRHVLVTHPLKFVPGRNELNGQPGQGGVG